MEKIEMIPKLEQKEVNIEDISLDYNPIKGVVNDTDSFSFEDFEILDTEENSSNLTFDTKKVVKEKGFYGKYRRFLESLPNLCNSSGSLDSSLKNIENYNNLAELLLHIALIKNVPIDPSTENFAKQIHLRELCINGKIYFVYQCSICGRLDFGKIPCGCFFCEECKKHLNKRRKNSIREIMMDCSHTYSVWTIPPEIREKFDSWNSVVLTKYDSSVDNGVMRLIEKDGEFFKAGKKYVDLFYTAVNNTLLQYQKKHKIKFGYFVIPHSHGSLEMNWSPHMNVIISSKALDKNNELIDFMFDFKEIQSSYKSNLEKLFNVKISSEVVQLKFQTDKKANSYFIPKKRVISKVVGYARTLPFNIKNIIKVDNSEIIFQTSEGRKQNKVVKLSPIEFFYRIIQHIPFENFRAVRHGGLYSNHNKNRNLYPKAENRSLKKEMSCRNCKNPIKPKDILGIVIGDKLVWIKPEFTANLDYVRISNQLRTFEISETGRVLESIPPPDCWIPIDPPKFNEIDSDSPNEDYKNPVKTKAENNPMSFYFIERDRPADYSWFFDQNFDQMITN